MPKSPHHDPGLIRLVQKDKASFPLGLKTKLSLGDFEGNTYHRKFSVGADNGRLYLSYELNERDEHTPHPEMVWGGSIHWHATVNGSKRVAQWMDTHLSMDCAARFNG